MAEIDFDLLKVDVLIENFTQLNATQINTVYRVFLSNHGYNHDVAHFKDVLMASNKFMGEAMRNILQEKLNEIKNEQSKH